MKSPPQSPTGLGPALQSNPVSRDRLVAALLALSVVLTLVAVFFINMLPISVTDFWWQLKTGELIFRQGAIPRHDVFSWTAAGQPWTVHEWLTELVFYLIYAHLPHWVLLGFKCGLAMVSCAVVLIHARQRTGSVPLGIGAALLAAWVLRNFADLRPQMLSFVLLAALHLALDLHHHGRLRRLPWLLPIVFALWANLHGGVLVGLILLVLWIVGQSLGFLVFKDRGMALPELALSLLVCGLAVGLNPNGFEIYTYPFQVLGHPEVMDYISEWWTPNFHTPEMRGFEVALLGTLGILAIARRNTTERRIGEVLMILALGHAALMSQRNTAAFGLFVAPVAVTGMSSLWREVSEVHSRWLDLSRRGIRVSALLTLNVALGVIIGVYVPPKPPARWYEHAIRMQDFPQDAVQMLREGMFPGRIYNDYVWGGYLIWELHPKRPVFIDGRAEVYYPTKAFDDEMLIHRVAPGWKEALDKRRVEVVLTASRGALAQALSVSPDWKLAFTGGVEVLFQRSKPLPPEPDYRTRKK